MLFQKAALLLASCHLALGATNRNIDLRALLTDIRRHWSPQTQIFFPSNPEFEGRTQRWTIYEEPTYKAAITPGSEEDVQKIVALASSLKIPFLATGGRHGYGTSFGKLDNGLAIDLSHFNTVNVDKNANTMTIGGSVRFDQIFDPLYAAGKEIATGSCSCVGMVGATLGAGVGRFQGIHGLIIDSLLSVRLVTADGRLITVSATSNPDLFWGLRGAGMNFGVITSATYRVYNLTNGGNVMSADLIFPAAKNASYFDVIESFEGRLPKELSLFTLVDYNETTNGAQIVSNFVYPGSESSFRALIKPFLDLQPVVANIYTVPWNKLVTTAGFGLNAAFCAKGNIHSMYSVNVREISADTYVESFGKLDRFYAATPAARASTMEIEFFPNQAVRAVPDATTAYPWRDAAANIMIQFSWTDDAVADASNALARELRADAVATSGYPDLSVYVSYAHSDESLEQIFGAEKLPRLAGLKKTWDPRNVFAYGNALPTHYP